MTELDTLADIVSRYAEQLKFHMPAFGVRMNQYGGYENNHAADIGRDRLVELAPSLVAYSEAVKHLYAARTLAPQVEENQPS